MTAGTLVSGTAEKKCWSQSTRDRTTLEEGRISGVETRLRITKITLSLVQVTARSHANSPQMEPRAGSVDRKSQLYQIRSGRRVLHLDACLCFSTGPDFLFKFVVVVVLTFYLLGERTHISQHVEVRGQGQLAGLGSLLGSQN